MFGLFRSSPLTGSARSTSWRGFERLCVLGSPQQPSVPMQKKLCLLTQASSLSGGRMRARRRRDKASKVNKQYRFVDRVRLRAKAGDGGNGCVSHRHVGVSNRGSTKRIPDGGNGGIGGSVIIIADPRQQTLSFSRPHIIAANGAHASSRLKGGAGAKNTIVRVPCGVIVKRVLDDDEVWNEEDRTIRKLTVNEEENQRISEYLTGEDYEGIKLFRPRQIKSIPVDPFNYRLGDDGFYHIIDDQAEEDVDGDDDDDQPPMLLLGDGRDQTNVAEKDQEGTNHSIDRGDLDQIDADLVHNDLDDIDEDDLIVYPDGSAWDDGDSDTFDEEDIGVDSSDDRPRVMLADLDKPGSWVLVARGGEGGIGNGITSSRMTPLPPEVLSRRAEPYLGEVCHLELELKLIADLGLVGFPNAGKSTLIAAMSRASPKIAPYPFTTLHPLVGTIEYRDGFQVMAADVPGLVKGASTGRGRGHDFLRHLERTKALLYMVDAAGVDGRDPIEDFRVLVDELAAFGDGDMLNRPALVAANKVDLLSKSTVESIAFDLGVVAEESGLRFDAAKVHCISAAVSGVGLPLLSREIRRVVEESERERQEDMVNAAI